MMGCDGIFDVLSNKDIQNIVEETISYFKEKQSNTPFKDILRLITDNILKLSLIRNSEDNVSVIFIAFKNLIFENDQDY